MGNDGNSNTTVKDAYGFSLNYYHNDYTPIANTAKPFAPISNLATAPANSSYKPLYNGNISAMMVNIPKVNGTNGPLLYNYTYDQLNRIVAMDAWKGLNIATNTYQATKLDAYNEAITYDPNGNIVTYKRHGDAALGLMDDMTYKYLYYYRDAPNSIEQKGQYNPNDPLPNHYSTRLTNQLAQVSDAAADINDPILYKNYNDLKGGQAAQNYQYDAIGNLISDAKEGITNIEWTVYGKISKITKENGTIIQYQYDPSGNRVAKNISQAAGGEANTTWYIRDASGNVMAVYETITTAGAVSVTTSLKELHKYGSSRLGILTLPSTVGVTTAEETNEIDEVNAKTTIFTQGKSFFELSNHLGNVLVTITDKQIATFSNGAIVSLEADVVTATDYYPFGMTMPGRTFAAQTPYRYGFNGKEKDLETTGTSTYDYGFRIYNPALGKFLSVDPLSKEYPWYTPYQFAGNIPIRCDDLDGLEPRSKIEKWKSTLGYINFGDPHKSKHYEGAKYEFVEGFYVFSAEKENNQQRNYFWYNEKSKDWNQFIPGEVPEAKPEFKKSFAKDVNIAATGGTSCHGNNVDLVHANQKKEPEIDLNEMAKYYSKKGTGGHQKFGYHMYGGSGSELYNADRAEITETLDLSLLLNCASNYREFGPIGTNISGANIKHIPGAAGDEFKHEIYQFAPNKRLNNILNFLDNTADGVSALDDANNASSQGISSAIPEEIKKIKPVIRYGNVTGKTTYVHNDTSITILPLKGKKK